MTYLNALSFGGKKHVIPFPHSVWPPGTTSTTLIQPLLWSCQTCDQDDDEVEIAVDNAAFMDDFFCQVSVTVAALVSIHATFFSPFVFIHYALYMYVFYIYLFEMKCLCLSD